VATLTGRTARSILLPCDTPGVATASPGGPDGLSRADAEAAWHAVTPPLAGTPHVRISKDGGRTYPGGHGPMEALCSPIGLRRPVAGSNCLGIQRGSDPPSGLSLNGLVTEPARRPTIRIRAGHDVVLSGLPQSIRSDIGPRNARGPR
jgi:hypothetical protein